MQGQFELTENALQPPLIICVEMVSNGPLLVDVFFNVLVQNGSAIGKLNSEV